MINFEHTHVTGFKDAIRGMRNPRRSWASSDSYCTVIEDGETLETAPYEFFVGEKDLDLMKRLAAGGSSHAKYRRMIVVYVDIIAPLYWWKHFDTYKVGTVANSTSTMDLSTLIDKGFEADDFSHEYSDKGVMDDTLEALNWYRDMLLKTSKIEWWRAIIQLLPESYNQRRTVMMNYEVLARIFRDRESHKLDEWRVFCDWIKTLPYAAGIIFKEEKQ